MDTELITLPKTNSFIRWMLFVTLVSITLTLLISWLLWFYLDREVINILLILLQNNWFTLDFWTFSTIIFSLAGAAFVLALPIAFIKYKSTFNNIFSFLSLILGLVVFGIGLYVTLELIKNPWIEDFVSIAKQNLMVSIPFYLTMLFAFLVVVTGFINLVLVKDPNDNSNRIAVKGLTNQQVTKPLSLPSQPQALTTSQTQATQPINSFTQATQSSQEFAAVKPVVNNPNNFSNSNINNSSTVGVANNDPVVNNSGFNSNSFSNGNINSNNFSGQAVNPNSFSSNSFSNDVRTVARVQNPTPLNNLTPKPLATIRVTIPVSSNGTTKDLVENIKVYQNKDNVSFDMNISD